jgi:hypothetical protein
VRLRETVRGVDLEDGHAGSPDGVSRARWRAPSRCS